jgi:hypothetical protein
MDIEKRYTCTTEARAFLSAGYIRGRKREQFSKERILRKEHKCVESTDEKIVAATSEQVPRIVSVVGD